jgi:hypothetical protein
MNPKQIPIILSVLLAAGVASAQWTGADLGTPAQTGSFTINGDGTTTINGGGNDIWDASDKGYYYYQPVTGLHWDVVVRVRSLEGPDNWTKAELMIRVPDSSGLPKGDDPFLALMTTRAAGQNEIRDQHRASRGGGAGEIAVSPVVRPSYPNTWFRLQRFGGKVTSYYGTNGVDWVKYSEINTLVGTGDWNGGSRLPLTVLVGFAVTGHNDTPPNVGTAIISDMKVTKAAVTEPNTIVVLTNTVNDTAYLGTEATFSFVTTNSGANPVFPGYNVMEYKWYKNATLITNAAGPFLTFLSRTEDNGASFYCVANIEAPNTSITLTGATASLTVLPGSIMYTNGVKQEFFPGGTRVATEAGGTVPGAVTVSRTMDFPQNLGNNYSRRVSGWFIPDTTVEHVFYLAADDDTDLFLSTDANPANKRIIARETGWAGSLAWSATDEACSSFYTEDAGVTFPYATGILLTAGQPYYIEAVHHQGGGGDNLAITYKHYSEYDPLPNDPTRMTNGLVLITSPVTTLSWLTQPTNTSSYEGVNAVLAAAATSDSEFLINYQWYRNNAPISGANNGTYTVTAPLMADSGAQFFVTASTALGELSITSAPVTLTVLQSVWEPGWASVEFFPGASLASVIAGTAGKPSYVTTTPKFEAGVNGEAGDDYSRRVSGYVVPPTTDDYAFFVNSDDASELYLSTDNTPAKKRLIAQQIDSSGTWQWLDGDNGRASQKRSDQWSPDSGATFPYQSGIRLTGGQKYYMEVIQREGSGNDHVEVTYKKLSDIDPVNGTDTRLFGSAIGINAVRCSWVAFTTQPTNTTAGLASTAKFVAVGATDSTQSIGVTGDPRPLVANPVYVMYQWQRNGVDIPGATDPTLAVTPVQPSDNGAVFLCKMRALGYANNALTPIWSNSQPATLTVTGPSVFEPGFVRVEFWENDASRAGIYKGTAGTPTYVTTSPAFTASVNGDSGANFGRRLSGYFIPPATDNYVFFMASDDDGDLFLSTDEQSSNKRLIARETGASGGTRNWLDEADRRSDQFTDPDTGLQPYTAGIPLVGGHKYYIEGVHHEGGGDDYFNVYYKRTSDADPVNGDDSTMVGSVIGTYVPPSSRVNFTLQPESAVVSTVSTVTFSALAETDSALSLGVTGDPRPRVTNPVYTLYQWQRNGVDIAGATEATYTRLIQPSDNAAQFVCKARGLGYANASLAPIWSNSLPATVTFTDTQAPTILYAASFTDPNVESGTPIVTIKFSEYMNPTLLSDPARYSITGVAVTSAIVNSNDFRSVRLVLSGIPTLPVNVVINGLADPAGNAVAGTSSAIQAVSLVSQDIGNLQNNGQPNPVYPSVLWVDGPRDYTAAVQGSDIWGTADGFNFLYEQKTGDFDVVVRQKSIDHTSHWAKGGLMVREALTPGSRHWNVLNTPLESDGIQAVDGSGMGASVVQCGKRDTTDGESGEWSLTLADPPDPAYPNAWLRLKRTGNLLQAYSSIDGMTWLLRGEQDPSTVGALTPLPTQVFVGIAATGHNNDDLYSENPPRFWNFMEFADYNSSFVPTLPTKVAARIVGANVEISWSPTGGRLESCTALGPNANWTDAGTANPAVLPATGTRFFRVVR